MCVGFQFMKMKNIRIIFGKGRIIFMDENPHTNTNITVLNQLIFLFILGRSHKFPHNSPSHFDAIQAVILQSLFLIEGCYFFNKKVLRIFKKLQCCQPLTSPFISRKLPNIFHHRVGKSFFPIAGRRFMAMLMKFSSVLFHFMRNHFLHHFHTQCCLVARIQACISILFVHKFNEKKAFYGLNERILNLFFRMQ